MRDPQIVVFGSLNMDLVYRTQRLPRPGQTITGHSYTEIPGGKGANQAVAASRLGGQVSMVGRIGDDHFGLMLLQTLKADGIDTRFVQITKGTSSGLAMIGVEDSGENSITIIPGANGQVTADDITAAEEYLHSADFLLLQLEIPHPAVLRAAELARQHGVRILFDPAPACDKIPEELLRSAIVCPNETEAEFITGIVIHSVDDAMAASKNLQSMGASLSIVTLGSKGTVFCEGGPCQHVAPFTVDAVDTTAAGDAFAAALAVALAEGQPTYTAIRIASAAGALTATRHGAQTSLPDRNTVDSFLRERAAR